MARAWPGEDEEITKAHSFYWTAVTVLVTLHGDRVTSEGNACGGPGGFVSSRIAQVDTQVLCQSSA